jgi:hypothetical protein
MDDEGNDAECVVCPSVEEIGAAESSSYCASNLGKQMIFPIICFLISAAGFGLAAACGESKQELPGEWPTDPNWKPESPFVNCHRCGRRIQRSTAIEYHGDYYGPVCGQQFRSYL